MLNKTTKASLKHALPNPNFDKPLPKTEVVLDDDTFMFNGKRYTWKLTFNPKTQAHDCTLSPC